MQGTGILFSEMTPPPGEEAAFHAWYDEEHIPVRMGAPGFLSARRYAVTGDAAGGFLAVYEMADLSALRTPEYGRIKSAPGERTRHMLGAVSGFTRYLGEETRVVRADGAGGAALDAPVLYAVWFTVPEDRLADFDGWYDHDHVPLLMRCADWRMVRRFRVTDGEPGRFNRLALHYLADAAALASPEREAARATPWRARLAAEPWFSGSYRVFAAHGARQLAGRG